MPLSVLQKSHLTLGYEPQTKPPVQTWPSSFHSPSGRKRETWRWQLWFLMCVTFTLQPFPHPLQSQGGRRALSILHNTCTGCGSRGLWARRVSRRAAQHRGGENTLKGIFFFFFSFLIKVWWFRVTSGWFWVAGGGSFSLSPKSVTQPSQPGSAQVVGLCFSVIHAAGLVHANRQTSAGKHGWEWASHLICPCLPASALYESLVPIAGWHHGFLVLFLLLFFLPFIFFSPTLDLLNSGRGKRSTHQENSPQN